MPPALVFDLVSCFVALTPQRLDEGLVAGATPKPATYPREAHGVPLRIR